MACGESNPSKGEENDLNNSSSSKIEDILSSSIIQVAQVV
jgi:hypothetical protein